MSDKLPKGWAACVLRDVADWRTGGTPPRSNANYFGTGVPWVKSGDLNDGPITSTEEQISEEGLANSSAKTLPVGTVCMALYGATIGKLGIMTFPAATNQACANALPKIDITTTQYLFFYLLSQRDAFVNLGQGGAQPNISQAIVRDYPFKLPPLPEQHRIVAKLEKLLAKVEACQKRLAKIPILLKRFRQAVLAAACSGRLTADWRESNSPEGARNFVLNAQVLRRSAYEQEIIAARKEGRRAPKPPKNQFLAQIEEAEELPSAWCRTGIGDVADCLDHLRIPVNRTTRLIRSGDVPYYGANGQVGTIDRHLFNEPLVLVVEDETFVGREKPFSYVIRGKSWVNNHAHVLRPVGGMPVEFLNMALSYYDFTPLTSGTTGRRKLTQEALVQAPIPVPPLAEQNEIVRRVEQLFTLADQLEARYTKAKAHFDKLTQSILAKAFRGELVPQNPADEPAEKLLERIRAQRAETAPTNRSRRRKEALTSFHATTPHKKH